MATDSGPEMTTSNSSVEQERTTASAEATSAAVGHKLQICVCGWRKVTSYLGLGLHQGKKGCLREERQRLHIDYFLRKESSQSNEAQQLDTNHSLQCISTTVTEAGTSNTAMVTAVNPTQPPRPVVERRLAGHRLHVKWPAAAAEKRLWETINTNLTLTLEQLKGTVEKELERMRGHLPVRDGALWSTREERQDKIFSSTNFQEATRDQAPYPRKETPLEKEGINVLQADINTRLASLHRAENLRKHRRIEQTRKRFYKDPFKFLKSLFRRGTLKTTKKDLKDHLKENSNGLQAIENTALPGKLKIWCLQLGLLPWVMWPLTVYEVPISRMEKMERRITSQIERWP